jgi:hypothetical protein
MTNEVNSPTRDVFDEDFEAVDEFKEPNLGSLRINFIQKWINYSLKYGLGYLLSDGIIGFAFNDRTKMHSIRDN